MATVTEMEARARILADQDNSTFPTSAQYRDLISDGAEELYNRMAAGGYVPKRTDLSVVANGSSSYTLGVTALSVLSVERVEGVERIPLRRARVEDVPYLRSLGTGTNHASHYDVTGGATAALDVELWPTPAGGSYIVRFIPRFVRFTSGADVWLGPPRSDDYIVTSAAIAALNKEGDDARDLRARLERIFGDVVQYVHMQDQQYPGTIRDSRTWSDWQRRRPFDDWRVAGVDEL